MTKTKKNGEKHTSEIVEVDYFDEHVIKITPSLLKNKLRKIWNPSTSITLLITLFMFTVALMGVLATADFKAVLGIPGDVWMALFLFISLFSFLAFIVIITVLCFRWKKNNLVTAEEFVDELIKDKNEKK